MSKSTCPCCGQVVDPDSERVHSYLNTVIRGPERERAAVVKYLRKWAAACPDDSATQHAMLNAAGYIEHGEHHKS